MTNDVFPGTSSPLDADDHWAQVEDIVADYIDRLNQGERITSDQVRSEHPGLAEELLEHLESFVDFGADLAPRTLGTLADYTLRRQIGRGGMGIVYEAWDNSMERRVALKVLPSAVAADNKAFLRFIREAKTAGQLSHPNVVPVFAMGVKEQTPYYAMEYIEGETLAQFLAAGKLAQPEAETPFGPKDSAAYFDKLVRVFAGVAEGLQHAHSKGIIHRDIKPSNLILDDEGRLRILDFGLARLEGQDGLTVSGDFVGTPLYVSPEQARARRVPVDHRTDIYSLGATLYEMLTWHPPFKGMDHQDTLSQIIQKDPPGPRSRNPRIPRDLETIVLKCLRKDPTERYGTAEALAQDLDRFVRGVPIEARQESSWERLSRRVRRHRWRLAGIAIATLLLLGVAGLWLKYSRVERRRKEVAYAESVGAGVRKLLQCRLSVRGASAERAVPSTSSIVTRDDFALDHRRLLLEAEGLLASAAAMLPSRPEAHYYLARVLALRGDEEGNRREISLALAKDPNFLPARSLQLELTGGKAEAPAPSEAQAEEEWARVWLEARLSVEAKEWRKAAESFGRLIEIQEDGKKLPVGIFLEALLERGNAHLKAKEYWQAQRDFMKAQAHWPKAIEPELLLGKACLHRGEAGLAEDIFLALHERVSPREKDEVVLWVADVYRLLNQPERGLGWADRLESPALKQRLRTSLLLDMGLIEEAIATGREALKSNPGDRALPIALGWALFCNRLYSKPSERAREVEEMIDLAEMSLDLEKKNAFAKGLLGIARSEQGRFKEAVDECDEAIEDEPERSIGYVARGEVNSHQGRLAEAEGDFRRAVALEPDFFLAQRGLGWVLAQRGKLQEAVAPTEKAMVINPKVAIAYEMRGDIACRQKQYDEALAWYKEAATKLPRNNLAYCAMANVYAAMGDIEKAIGAQCKAVRAQPEKGFPHKMLAQFLNMRDSTAPVAELDELIDVYEGRERSQNGAPHILWVRGALHLHADKRRDLDAAMAYTSRAVEGTNRKDPEILTTLAQIHAVRGKKAEAILLMEEALTLPTALRRHEELLETLRRQHLPDLASYASIDAALTSWSVDAAKDGKLLENFRPFALDESGRNRLLYLEGCFFQRSRKYREAADAFTRLVAMDPGAVEPHLGLADALRAAGESEKAEDHLRSVLETPPCSDRRMWDRWVAIVLNDLKLSPGRALATFPTQARGGPESERADVDYAGDIRWLIEQLDRGVVRINCGGEEWRDASGVVWGRDRFYCGGAGDTERHPLRRKGGAYDGSIHDSARYFAFESLRRGYSFPLENGEYLVTLHFVEKSLCEPGSRSFHIVIEGEERERSYEPWNRRCEEPDIKAFSVHIEDGVLDVGFVPEKGDAIISGIEVKRAR